MNLSQVLEDIRIEQMALTTLLENYDTGAMIANSGVLGIGPTNMGSIEDFVKLKNTVDARRPAWRMIMNNQKEWNWFYIGEYTEIPLGPDELTKVVPGERLPYPRTAITGHAAEGDIDIEFAVFCDKAGGEILDHLRRVGNIISLRQ